MAGQTDHDVPLRADASPTKAFFVRMLTRDISLDDCILDLIDNSIDSAWGSAGVKPTAFEAGDKLNRYVVDVTFDGDTFTISDNCGGISLDNAAEYAFTFGRKSLPEGADVHDEYTVGVYGIGMKRAVFKIGDSIEIRSSHLTDAGLNESFAVPINVPQWLAATELPWDFDIEPMDPMPQPGVTIEVKNLSEDARRRFLDPTYERSLIRTLSRDYLLPLMQGLVINVNGSKVPFQPIELLTGESFTPLRQTYSDGDVTISIIAGMFSAPPDDNEPETTREDRTSGWYIVCNGRVVLAADRTASTGWGVGEFPRWHGQYSGFVGMVLFSSANPALLPMTTTKRNVNPSSTLYQRAVNHMLKPARAWIDYTNARKSALDRAKKLESEARPIEVSHVAESETVVLPRLRSSRTKVANVNYSVPLTRMRNLARALGNMNMTYRDVGMAAFDYTYDAQVDEDE